MNFTSINPATGELLETYQAWSSEQLEAVLTELPDAAATWARVPVPAKLALLRCIASLLRLHSESYARLITLEMGKRITEARAEIEKCAAVCDYYAENGSRLLADERVDSDATRSYIAYQPLGTILTIMPWNFPFWQVFRSVIGKLLAGNTVLVKHAPTVTGCALAIERLFREAGFPEHSYRTLLISVELTSALIADPRVHGVSFTGSVNAGRDVAARAGANLKKCVLELGGSDPFIVLEDADLERAAAQAAASRFVNGGQSCSAAKRFILVDAIADRFLRAFQAQFEALRPGDPLRESTTLAPLARPDLRDTLHRQVTESVSRGAVLLTGGGPIPGPGNFYRPSILDHVYPGMPAFDEEVFGPVAAVTHARDDAHAISLANQSRYGLGASVWTGDRERGEAMLRQLHCGMGFLNGMVKTDPRLPCGGIKSSGFGRELYRHGVHEFANAKTVWIR